MKVDPAFSALLLKIASNQEAIFTRMDQLEKALNKGIAVTEKQPVQQVAVSADQLARKAIAPYLLNPQTL
jgi:hypothetical protein